jgi:hypothetical protein
LADSARLIKAANSSEMSVAGFTAMAYYRLSDRALQ